MSLLRLIRFPNLVIVAITQYLLYYRLIRPELAQAGLEPVFDHIRFAWLCGATLMATAYGYVINDLSDYRIDRINRSERMVIGRLIPFRTGYWLAFVFALVGFIISLYLALYFSKLDLLGLYPLAVGGLYLYSVHFKRQALTGNLLIAAYCSGAAALIWLAEQPALQQLARLQPGAAGRIWSVFVWYLVFAFLITAFRELVKDMEDMRGDREANCRTAPIRWGEEPARWLAITLGGALLLFIGWYGYLYNEQFGKLALAYMAIAIGSPLAAALFGLQRAHSEQAYHQVSQLTKLVMLTGLMLMWFI